MSDTLIVPTSDYIEHLKTTGKMGGAKTWGSLLRTFEHWLEDRDPPLTIDEVSATIVDEYLSTVGSPRSVLNAIRGYFRFRYMQVPMGDPSAAIEMQRYNQLTMVRPKRKQKKFEKISLTTPDLKVLLERAEKMDVSPELYAGLVVLFYFGARPREMAEFLASARISFENRDMFILTEKTLVERYLAWHPKLDPYMKTWYDFVMDGGKKGLPYPGQWLTVTLKNHMGRDRVIKGVEVTARTARRTFQTQMRLMNVPDIIIRAVLGHTDKTISDVYTDWTQFAPIIKDSMVNNHYMVKAGVI
jgi:integrase